MGSIDPDRIVVSRIQNFPCVSIRQCPLGFIWLGESMGDSSEC